MPSVRLCFLEYLALPNRVGNELGLPMFDWIDDRIWQNLPYTINLSKMSVLRSIKTLKELLIGDSTDSEKDQNILRREIPHLKKFDHSSVGYSNSFEVAVPNTEDFKFCPNCNKYDKNRDITKLHLEGWCMHHPSALGGAICKLHHPNFFFLKITLP